jgi:riboflavin synthase
MFTGLIAHLGKVAATQTHPRGDLRLVIDVPSAITHGIEVKDSIAINGVCLTVVEFDERLLHFDVIPETLGRSDLSRLLVGDRVNVELSLRLGDRLGGHLVYGHIDATARILKKEHEGQGYRFFIERSSALARFIVEKGFIAVDGVSLTVARADGDTFELALIPETLARTTIGTKKTGDLINIEVDPIARYVITAMENYR